MISDIDLFRKMNMPDSDLNLTNTNRLAKYERFILVKLPAVARTEVIRLMDMLEQIKLALTSKRMEFCIKYASIRKKLLEICVMRDVDFIGIKTDNLTIFCGKPYRVDETQQTVMARDEMTMWYDEKIPVLKNASNLFQHLQGIIKCKAFGFKLDLSGNFISAPELKEVLQSDDFKNFEVVNVTGRNLDPKLLDLVMDTAHDDRDIEVLNPAEIPLDYKHENAFKFLNANYRDARWVRIEYLFSMRNRWQLGLDRNNLTDEDLNRYMKYWEACDHNMVRMLKISRDSGSRLTLTDLFKDLVVLKTSRLGRRVHLILSSKKTKKYPLLSVQILRRYLSMTEWSPEFPYLTADQARADSFAREYSILQILNKIKSMEDELTKLRETGTDALKMEMMGEEIHKMKKELDLQRVHKELNGTYSLT